ncbi:MAG: transglycosylase domain-containing protein [Clostridiales bacterium]|nr:transglycosylase domain-containing protein [Clostridiales bacterium]
MDYSDIGQNDKRIKRYYNSRVKKAKNKVIVIIMRVALILAAMGIFGGASVAFGAYLSIIEERPKLDSLFASINYDVSYDSVIINEMTGLEVDRLNQGESRQNASSEEIPLRMKQAMVAIEDERFYEHDGIDLRGMVRALWSAVTTSSTQGASTITQQVIKNKLGYQYNTFETKFQEQIMAVDFEESLVEQYGSKEAAKDYILTVYLNTVALGHGNNGVQAAAGYYFNKDVSELTLSECATIAAITSNPVWRDPLRQPERNKERQKYVLDSMLKLGYITQDEYDEAFADDVYSRVLAVNGSSASRNSTHSYYNDQVIISVRQDLIEQYGLTSGEANNMLYSGGLRIYTAQDPDIQAVVDAVYMDESMFPKNEYNILVEYHADIRNIGNGMVRSFNNVSNRGVVKTFEEADAYVENLKSKVVNEGEEITYEIAYKIPQPQSSMAVIDHTTGYVAAIAGGRGEKSTNMGTNRATGMVRQPGSTFKVLAAYAPGVDLGLITPATVEDDVPRYNSNGELWPLNWYKTGYRGLKSAREGISQSMNILAVKHMERVGIGNSMDYLENFGFTSIVTDLTKRANDYNLSTALGGLTYGVSPLELTAAFGAIANQGLYMKPIFYTKVLDYNGNVILENIPQPQRVLKNTSAFLLTDMMKDTLTTGTGTAAALSNAYKGIPTAGKTGTTTSNNDLWFVGYTPYYTAAVWLGYDLNGHMTSATTDENIQKKIWKRVMEEIHVNLPAKEFPRPNGIREVTICARSGKLPVEGLCDHDPAGIQLRTEYFEAGTEPTEYCDVHMSYTFCVYDRDHIDGNLKRPTSFCPEDHVGTAIGIVRPEPYYGSDIIADQWLQVPQTILNNEYCIGHSTPQQPFMPEATPNPYDNIIPDVVMPGIMQTLEPPPEGGVEYYPPQT